MSQESLMEGWGLRVDFNQANPDGDLGTKVWGAFADRLGGWVTVDESGRTIGEFLNRNGEERPELRWISVPGIGQEQVADGVNELSVGAPWTELRAIEQDAGVKWGEVLKYVGFGAGAVIVLGLATAAVAHYRYGVDFSGVPLLDIVNGSPGNGVVLKVPGAVQYWWSQIVGGADNFCIEVINNTGGTVTVATHEVAGPVGEVCFNTPKAVADIPIEVNGVVEAVISPR